MATTFTVTIENETGKTVAYARLGAPRMYFWQKPDEPAECARGPYESLEEAACAMIFAFEDDDEDAVTNRLVSGARG